MTALGLRTLGRSWLAGPHSDCSWKGNVDRSLLVYIQPFRVIGLINNLDSSKITAKESSREKEVERQLAHMHYGWTLRAPRSFRVCFGLKVGQAWGDFLILDVPRIIIELDTNTLIGSNNNRSSSIKSNKCP